MYKKQIENIFSKQKESAEIKETPNKKFPIIVDTREKQSLVASKLIEQKANIKFEKLEIGDYLIGGKLIVERKTFSDFQSSIIDKRFLNQLIEMQKYDEKILIIEGFYYQYKSSNIHENAQRGALLSSLLEFKTPIFFTENSEDTAKALIVLAKKYEKEKKEISLRHKKTETSLQDKKQFILEGFPGIGPTTAKKLISEFKTLKNIFNSEKKDLQKDNILDENKINEMKEILEK